MTFQPGLHVYVLLPSEPFGAFTALMTMACPSGTFSKSRLHWLTPLLVPSLYSSPRSRVNTCRSALPLPVNTILPSFDADTVARL